MHKAIFSVYPRDSGDTRDSGGVLRVFSNDTSKTVVGQWLGSDIAKPPERSTVNHCPTSVIPGKRRKSARVTSVTTVTGVCAGIRHFVRSGWRADLSKNVRIAGQ